MKIETIKISAKQASEVGLKEATLSKLGQIVLIAGRNGAGKSRLLNMLPKEVGRLRDINRGKYKSMELLKEYRENLVYHGGIYENEKIDLSEAEDFEIEGLKNKLIISQQTIAYYEKLIIEQEELLASINDIKLSGRGDFFYYVPKELELKDPTVFTKKSLYEGAEKINEAGLRHLPNGTLAAIQVSQNRYYRALHPISEATASEKEEAIRSYTQLRDIVRQFIGAELGRNRDDDAMIFGKPLGRAMLSHGQTVLLQFAVALHAQELSLPDLILLLDEPENHLHPAALNYVLDRLQAVVTRGQIWIATHSINVLAHFDNPTIYYMEDGALSYAGDIPEKVLAGLLGDEEEREKLANFLALPFEMSSTRFAYESLLVPTVVMTEGNDPQLQQIQQALRQVRDVQGKVRVLDFGAGRGRLIATFEDIEPVEAEVQSASWLDYVAYDPYPTNAAECQANIERVYGPVSDRYYSDLGPLRTRYHDGSFDIVVLTNVFHEIPPKQWSKVLHDIMQLLKPEGFLLIVEDQRLPHGERAHEYGFLLFDTLEFRRLFAIGAQDEEQGLYVVQTERGGRLKAHYFKRELLERMTPETKKLALVELQANAKREISRIREQQEHSFKNGKLHALWMNQFANAQLALEEL
jgi:ABC-type multidrug transport system ATPase subunit